MNFGIYFSWAGFNGMGPNIGHLKLKKKNRHENREIQENVEINFLEQDSKGDRVSVLFSSCSCSFFLHTLFLWNDNKKNLNNVLQLICRSHVKNEANWAQKKNTLKRRLKFDIEWLCPEPLQLIYSPASSYDFSAVGEIPQTIQWTNQNSRQIHDRAGANCKRGKRVRARHGWLNLVLLLIGWESSTRFFSHSQNIAMQNKNNCEVTFDVQLKCAAKNNKLIKKCLKNHKIRFTNVLSPIFCSI